jgi:radical SAM protein with 4Fe4S-binding SPASM domain
MKIVQSYIQSKNFKNKKFYTFLLNYLVLKKNYGYVVMYCNKIAYDSFIKYIPYDEIILLENKSSILSYKIQVIEDINEDFIYIDPEFILFDDSLIPYIKNLYNFDILVKHTNPKEHFGPHHFINNNKKLLNDININTDLYDDKYFCTDIIGMNLKFKEKYISNVKKIEQVIKNNMINGNYKHYNIILDNLLIYLTYLNNNLKSYEFISPDDIELGINYCADKYKFTIFETNNSITQNINLVKNKIHRDFPNNFINIDNYENNYKPYNYHFKYKLSFCVSCMNRLEFLKKTLLHNLNLINSLTETYNIELVLLNYNSEDDMDEYLNQDIFKQFIDDKILIYKKVNNKDFFHRTNARNIAHLAATGDILCNSDVDCYLSEELIKETYDAFNEHGLNNIIFCGSTNYNFGYICLSKYNFILLDGYNENIYYYGAEDYDILIRFCLKTKNKIKILEKDYLNLLINHNDSFRSITQYNKWTTNFVNSILVYYNLKNNITNPNNGIFGKDEHIKIKDVFNYDYFNRYVLNDDEITNMWNDIKSINNDNWLNHIIMKKFNNFLENNCLNHKIIEITTMVGCKNMCLYCPQDAFLKNYKSDVKYLTVDIWKDILKNIDKNVEIQFSGFAENFMNPNFPSILKYTHKNGYKITIFTTLEGYNENIDLSDIEINNLYFHEYNGKSFNRKKFYSNVDNFLANNKIINYHGILKIGQQEEFTRANNNKRKKTEHKFGKIKCNFGKDFLWQQNNLLLNGDVYICCQDWGLKHKIGNLKSDNLYSNNINNERLKLQNLQLMEDSDIICRDCEFSKKI